MGATLPLTAETQRGEAATKVERRFATGFEQPHHAKPVANRRSILVAAPPRYVSAVYHGRDHCIVTTKGQFTELSLTGERLPGKVAP